MSDNTVPKDEFPRVSLTADVIFLRTSDNKAALIKRLKDPSAGKWAVVGGFFNAADHHGEKMDASVIDAAVREAKEEINIDIRALTAEESASFDFIAVADKPDRDPRGRVVTFIFLCIVNDKKATNFNPIAGDDAGEINWFDLSDILNGNVELAFDHVDYFRAATKFLASLG